jgi:hypothetical protein
MLTENAATPTQHCAIACLFGVIGARAPPLTIGLPFRRDHGVWTA